MLADLRYALRGFRRSPVFALAAVLPLTLGIGANTAIFSLVNAILLRSLPVREPNRLVIFALSTPDRFEGSAISANLYQQIRDKNTVLEGFAAVASASLTLSAGVAAMVEGQAVSGNFFETLGISAVIGRVILPGDDRISDSPPVCVLGYGLWLQRFGGDRNVVGQKVQINGQPFTILGVTPREFSGLNQGSQTDVFVPLVSAGTAGMSRHGNFLQTFGRLQPGVSVAQAQVSMDVLYHQLETPQPLLDKLSGSRIVLRPGRQGFVGLRRQYERPLQILMVVVGLVLLIACANITNLLMARASGRAKEIAVRLALGASRARLVQQLLVESMLLTIIGAALGMALAYWVDHALLSLAPQQFGSSALNVDVDLDWRVLLFTLGVAVVAGVLSGIAPAVLSTPRSLGLALKGEVGVRAPGRFSYTNALVVVQIAVSLVLLIGAGLFLRSLRNLRSVDPGFDADRLVVLTLEPGLNGYTPTVSQNLFERLMERARNLPGVIAASPGLISPLSGEFSMGRITVPSYQPQQDEFGVIRTDWVGPDYFKTLRTPLVAGRVFTELDGLSNRVAIVNERAARHFWPHESPIGKHVMLGQSGDCEIVGVVKDVKGGSLREEAQAAVYLPFRQSRRSRMTMQVRVAGKTTPVMAALIREIHLLDPKFGCGQRYHHGSTA